MKQESKVKRIYQAFTEESDLPLEVVEQRRKICEGCVFNSKNVDRSDFTILQKLQHETGDFCTKCSCYIVKKIQRSSEACGLEDVGEIPKWNRIKLKTEGETHLNVKNLSPEICNIKLSFDNSEFEIDLFDDVVDTVNMDIELDNEDIVIRGVYPYCGCLTVGINHNRLFITIITDVFPRSTTFRKSFEVHYTLKDSEELHKTVFAVIGKTKENF